MPRRLRWAFSRERMTAQGLQETPSMPRVTFNRWSGALLGTLIAVGDTLFLRAFGIAFEMRGLDVTWFVGFWFGSSMALAGFLAGYAVELRRRERHSNELVRRQMDEIRATR